MTERRYDWKRFWLPRGEACSLWDGGFVADPESSIGARFNPSLVGIESFDAIPCVALLGEPGIGKSTALAQCAGYIQEGTTAGTGVQTLSFDLNQFQTDGTLRSDIFHGKMFREWVEGDHRLVLLLDSLDEARLRIDAIAQVLSTELRACPTDRLNFRIACRSADWPTQLEGALLGIWGKDAVQIMTLAPLRRRDVTDAARAEGIDVDEFMAELARKEAVPLAIKPITLNMLLRLFGRGGALPPTRRELYELGCLDLCEERNPSRRDSRRVGTLSPRHRLAVAARLAALTILTNRRGIFTGPALDAPDACATLFDVTGSYELAEGDQFPVGEAEVREVLDTGLFATQAPQVSVWAHQTYAEFLAARYLALRLRDPTQRSSLLFHVGREARVVPQLAETAAWLACLAPPTFAALLESDPQVLLRSDVAAADATDRARLVEQLLRLLDEEKIHDFDWDNRRHYVKLGHPGLADQVRPYVIDPSKGLMARRAAIEIAEECGVCTLQELLLGVVLDSTERYMIRSKAAYALVELADDDVRRRMIPLLRGECGPDPDDQLKGCALRALWPDHLTAKDVFSDLLSPRSGRLHGSYCGFLDLHLIRHLKTEDLPVALNWLASQPAACRADFDLRRVMKGVVRLAWRDLDAPSVTEGLAAALQGQLADFDSIETFHDPEEDGPSPPWADESKRRRLLRCLIPRMTDDSRGAALQGPCPLLSLADFAWLLDEAESSEAPEIQRSWAIMAERVYRTGDRVLTDRIVDAAERHPIIAEVFRGLLQPIDLNSEQVHRIREDRKRHKIWLAEQAVRQERREKARKLEPPLPVQTANLLDRIDQGDLDAWWQLNFLLTYDEEHQARKAEDVSDLTALPSWETLDQRTRARIVDAAGVYVREAVVNDSEWFGRDIDHYRPACAGYRALMLIAHLRPLEYEELPPEIWRKWAAILLAFSRFEAESALEFRRRFVRRCYLHARDHVLSLVRAILTEQGQRPGSLFVLDLFDGEWDEYLTGVMLDELLRGNLRLEPLESLLAQLVRRSVPEAVEYAESAIRSRDSDDPEAKNLALIAGRVLILENSEAAWPSLWGAITSDEEFGRALLQRAASGSHEAAGSVMRSLADDHAADVFIWLVRQLPFRRHPQTGDIESTPPQDHLGSFRDDLLRHLENRGTPSACDALRRISAAFPEHPWLKWTVLRAEDRTRQANWLPPTPRDIVALAESNARRLVRTDQELLDVVIESLDRLQQALHDHTPQVPFLWDEGESPRPKSEGRISDYIKNWLARDLGPDRGVIVAREVEIRARRPRGIGERTDLLVEAMSVGGGPRNKLSVIVEVKGCWNDDLITAMKTQLVDTYMAESTFRCGLYVVAWCCCGQWKDCPKRHREAMATVTAATEFFDQQAKSLCTGQLQVRAFVLDAALR